MRKLTLLAALSLFSSVCFAQLAHKEKEKQEVKTEFPQASQFSKTKLSYKIIDAASHTYCYDIYADGRLMIHQPSVPAMPGNKGFKTKTGAKKVADLVITKIKKGEMPPTVSIPEMKNLKAL